MDIYTLKAHSKASSNKIMAAVQRGKIRYEYEHFGTTNGIPSGYHTIPHKDAATITIVANGTEGEVCAALFDAQVKLKAFQSIQFGSADGRHTLNTDLQVRVQPTATIVVIREYYYDPI